MDVPTTSGPVVPIDRALSFQEPELPAPSYDLMHIQACIGKERQQLAALENELPSLTNPHHMIHKQRLSIKKRLSHLQQQLAALIPVEILLEIFRMAIGIPKLFNLDAPLQEDPETIPQTPTLRKEPWFLASVCRAWRKVMLTNPILWSHVRFSELTFLLLLPQRHYRKARAFRLDAMEDAARIGRKMDALRLHLDRSGDRDLFVTISRGSAEHDEPLKKDASDSLLPALEIVSQHSHRLRYLYLHHTLASSITGPFGVPRLHYLDLFIGHIHHYLPLSSQCSFRQTTSIAHARVYHHRQTPLNPAQLRQLLPWKHLSTLSLHGDLDFTYQVLIMKMSANIVHLDLHFTQNCIFTAPSVVMFTVLPKLERLSLRGFPVCWIRLMDIVVTPSLQSLRINNAPSTTIRHDVVLDLLKLVDRSHCNLSSLNISLYSGDMHRIVTLLRDPRIALTLRKFSFSMTWKADHHTVLSRTLSEIWSLPGPTETAMVPSLETIMLDEIYHEGMQPILDVLEKNVLGPDRNRLKTFMVRGIGYDRWFCRNMENPGPISERIARLKKLGLDFQIRHLHSDNQWPDL